MSFSIPPRASVRSAPSMHSIDLKVSRQPRHTLPHIFDERNSLNDDLESYGDMEDVEDTDGADFNHSRAHTSHNSVERRSNSNTEPRHQRVMNISHTSNTMSSLPQEEQLRHNFEVNSKRSISNFSASDSDKFERDNNSKLSGFDKSRGSDSDHSNSDVDYNRYEKGLENNFDINNLNDQMNSRRVSTISNAHQGHLYNFTPLKNDVSRRASTTNSQVRRISIRSAGEESTFQEEGEEDEDDSDDNFNHYPKQDPLEDSSKAQSDPSSRTVIHTNIPRYPRNLNQSSRGLPHTYQPQILHSSQSRSAASATSSDPAGRGPSVLYSTFDPRNLFSRGQERGSKLATITPSGYIRNLSTTSSVPRVIYPSLNALKIVGDEHESLNIGHNTDQIETLYGRGLDRHEGETREYRRNASVSRERVLNRGKRKTDEEGAILAADELNLPSYLTQKSKYPQDSDFLSPGSAREKSSYPSFSNITNLSDIARFSRANHISLSAKAQKNSSSNTLPPSEKPTFVQHNFSKVDSYSRKMANRQRTPLILPVLPTVPENANDNSIITLKLSVAALRDLHSLSHRNEELEQDLFESHVDFDHQHAILVDKLNDEMQQSAELRSEARDLSIEIRETEERYQKAILQLQLTQISSSIVNKDGADISTKENSESLRAFGVESSVSDTLSDIQLQVKQMTKDLKKDDDVAKSLSKELEKTLVVARSRENLITNLRREISHADAALANADVSLHTLNNSSRRQTMEITLLRRALAYSQSQTNNVTALLIGEREKLDQMNTTTAQTHALLEQVRGEAVALTLKLTASETDIKSLREKWADREKELERELENGAKEARETSEKDREKYAQHIQHQELSLLTLRESLVEAKKDTYGYMKQLMDQQELIFNLQRKLAENMQETEAAHGKQKEIQELYARTEKNLQDLELKRKRELEELDRIRLTEQQQLQKERSLFEEERHREREELERSLSLLERELRAKTVSSVERAKLELERQRISIELEKKQLQQDFARKERDMAMQVRQELEKEREKERLAFQREVQAFEQVEKERLAKLQSIQHSLKQTQRKQQEKTEQMNAEKEKLAQIAAIQLQQKQKQRDAEKRTTKSKAIQSLYDDEHEDYGSFGHDEELNLSNTIPQATVATFKQPSIVSKDDDLLVSFQAMKPANIPTTKPATSGFSISNLLADAVPSTSSNSSTGKRKRGEADSSVSAQALTKRPRKPNLGSDEKLPMKVANKQDNDIVLSFKTNKEHANLDRQNFFANQSALDVALDQSFGSDIGASFTNRSGSKARTQDLDDFNAHIEDHDHSEDADQDINNSVSTYLNMIKPTRLLSKSKSKSESENDEAKKSKTKKAELKPRKMKNATNDNVEEPIVSTNPRKLTAVNVVLPSLSFPKSTTKIVLPKLKH